MEMSPRERATRPDSVPHLRKIDVDEQPAAIIADALPRDSDRVLHNCLFEAQRAQRAGRVPRQVDARARLVPRGLPLDDLGREAGTGKHSSNREAADAGADDEDSPIHPHQPTSCEVCRARKSRIASLTAPAFSSLMRCDAAAISIR